MRKRSQAPRNNHKDHHQNQDEDVLDDEEEPKLLKQGSAIVEKPPKKRKFLIRKSLNFDKSRCLLFASEENNLSSESDLGQDNDSLISSKPEPKFEKSAFSRMSKPVIIQQKERKISLLNPYQTSDNEGSLKMFQNQHYAFLKSRTRELSEMEKRVLNQQKGSRRSNQGSESGLIDEFNKRIEMKFRSVQDGTLGSKSSFSKKKRKQSCRNDIKRSNNNSPGLSMTKKLFLATAPKRDPNSENGSNEGLLSSSINGDEHNVSISVHEFGRKQSIFFRQNLERKAEIPGILQAQIALRRQNKTPQSVENQRNQFKGSKNSKSGSSKKMKNMESRATLGQRDKPSEAQSADKKGSKQTLLTTKKFIEVNDHFNPMDYLGIARSRRSHSQGGKSLLQLSKEALIEHEREKNSKKSTFKIKQKNQSRRSSIRHTQQEGPSVNRMSPIKSLVDQNQNLVSGIDGKTKKIIHKKNWACKAEYTGFVQPGALRDNPAVRSRKQSLRSRLSRNSNKKSAYNVTGRLGSGNASIVADEAHSKNTPNKGVVVRQRVGAEKSFSMSRTLLEVNKRSMDHSMEIFPKQKSEAFIPTNNILNEINSPLTVIKTPNRPKNAPNFNLHDGSLMQSRGTNLSQNSLKKEPSSSSLTSEDDSEEEGWLKKKKYNIAEMYENNLKRSRQAEEEAKQQNRQLLNLNKCKTGIDDSIGGESGFQLTPKQQTFNKNLTALQKSNQYQPNQGGGPGGGAGGLSKNRKRYSQNLSPQRLRQWNSGLQKAQGLKSSQGGAGLHKFQIGFGGHRNSISYSIRALGVANGGGGGYHHRNTLMHQAGRRGSIQKSQRLPGMQPPGLRFPNPRKSHQGGTKKKKKRKMVVNGIPAEDEENLKRKKSQNLNQAQQGYSNDNSNHFNQNSNKNQKKKTVMMNSGFNQPGAGGPRFEVMTRQKSMQHRQKVANNNNLDQGRAGVGQRKRKMRRLQSHYPVRESRARLHSGHQRVTNTPPEQLPGPDAPFRRRQNTTSTMVHGMGEMAMSKVSNFTSKLGFRKDQRSRDNSGNSRGKVVESRVSKSPEMSRIKFATFQNAELVRKSSQHGQRAVNQNRDEVESRRTQTFKNLSNKASNGGGGNQSFKQVARRPQLPQQGLGSFQMIQGIEKENFYNQFQKMSAEDQKKLMEIMRQSQKFSEMKTPKHSSHKRSKTIIKPNMGNGGPFGGVGTNSRESNYSKVISRACSIEKRYKPVNAQSIEKVDSETFQAAQRRVKRAKIQRLAEVQVVNKQTRDESGGGVGGPGAEGEERQLVMSATRGPYYNQKGSMSTPKLRTGKSSGGDKKQEKELLSLIHRFSKHEANVFVQND